ncbi:MAG: SEC-C domain-containing protein, partial [Clostridia bacterium]|nr:SEC-C domain-containing protein [Clostridia bacterium]
AAAENPQPRRAVETVGNALQNSRLVSQSEATLGSAKGNAEKPQAGAETEQKTSGAPSGDEVRRNIFEIKEAQQKPLQYKTNMDSPAIPVKAKKKVGPNDPCPCGSGKKYKKCCGSVLND